MRFFNWLFPPKVERLEPLEVTPGTPWAERVVSADRLYALIQASDDWKAVASAMDDAAPHWRMGPEGGTGPVAAHIIRDMTHADDVLAAALVAQLDKAKKVRDIMEWVSVEIHDHNRYPHEVRAIALLRIDELFYIEE